jgi:predicted dienelactone hydrolase
MPHPTHRPALFVVALSMACGRGASDPAGTGAPEQPEPPPQARDPDQPGPYAVGATTLRVDDPRGGTLTVEVWYPAIDPGGDPDPYTDFPIVGVAFRDPVPDTRGAPYPVVAFSHGFGGIRTQSIFLTEHLASHGVVVVAPDHRHNTLLDLDDTLTGQVLVERPGEVARAVDALEQWEHAGMAETDRYVVSGHSFGALTSLIVGGGLLDFDAGLAHCAETRTAGCAFFEGRDLGDPALAQPDPRAVGVAVLCPGGGYAFGETGLDELAPSLALAGDKDGDLPYDSEGRPTMDALPAPRTLATLAGAGHWGVTDLCSLLPTLLDCAGEAGGYMEPDRVKAVARTLVMAHAGDVLTDDPRYQEFLDAGAWPDDDVSIE